jgi:hypothetical protein
MPYNYRLPDDASEELRLAAATAAALAKLIPIVAAANPANRGAVQFHMQSVIEQYGQGDSEAAKWIRDNFVDA